MSGLAWWAWEQYRLAWERRWSGAGLGCGERLSRDFFATQLAHGCARYPGGSKVFL